MLFFGKDNKTTLINYNNEYDFQNSYPNLNIFSSSDIPDINDQNQNNLLSINNGPLFTELLDNNLQSIGNELENNECKSKINDENIFKVYLSFLNYNNENNNKDIFPADNIPSEKVNSKNPKPKNA